MTQSVNDTVKEVATGENDSVVSIVRQREENEITDMPLLKRTCTMSHKELQNQRNNIASCVQTNEDATTTNAPESQVGSGEEEPASDSSSTNSDISTSTKTSQTPNSNVELTPELTPDLPAILAPEALNAQATSSPDLVQHPETPSEKCLEVAAIGDKPDA